MGEIRGSPVGMLEPQLCRPRPRGQVLLRTPTEAQARRAPGTRPTGSAARGAVLAAVRGAVEGEGEGREARAVENVAEAGKSVVMGQACPLTSRGSGTTPRWRNQGRRETQKPHSKVTRPRDTGPSLQCEEQHQMAAAVNLT